MNRSCVGSSIPRRIRAFTSADRTLHALGFIADRTFGELLGLLHSRPVGYLYRLPYGMTESTRRDLETQLADLLFAHGFFASVWARDDARSETLVRIAHPGRLVA